MVDRLCLDEIINPEEALKGDFRVVVHLKGFASGLDVEEDAATIASCAALLSALKEIKDVEAVAWDGDEWNEKSYTVLLPRIAELGYRLIAFRRRDSEDHESFTRSWSELLTYFTCYHVQARDYLELATEGLNLTQANLALCLGGGPRVAAEARCNPHVRYKIFDCGRWHSQGYYEQPALVSDANVELISMRPEAELDQVCGTPARYFLSSCPNGVYVRPSSLTNCGLGLYTAQSRSTHEQVCIYRGTILTTHQALRLSNKAYLMRLGQNSYIDASTHREVLARYINDPRHPRAANVRFLKKPAENCAFVLATRPIAAGEELFVSYGTAYWLAARAAGIRPAELSDAAVRSILKRAREEENNSPYRRYV